MVNQSLMGLIVNQRYYTIVGTYDTNQKYAATLEVINQVVRVQLISCISILVIAHILTFHTTKQFADSLRINFTLYNALPSTNTDIGGNGTFGKLDIAWYAAYP